MMDGVLWWLLVTAQLVFALMAIGIFVSFRTYRRWQDLLGAAIYGAAAAASFLLGSWWPLLAGFALAWGVRFLGVDTEGRG